MAKIIVMISGKNLKEVHVPMDRALTIGRDPTNSLVLDNPAVSRYHARIEKQGWPYYVIDMKSTNGTHVNGKPLQGQASLKNNDRIGIGKFLLVFREEGTDQGGPTHAGETTMAVK